MLNKIALFTICLLVAAVLPAAAEIVDACPKPYYSPSSDRQPLCDSFGQDKTSLVQKLLNRGGAFLVNGNDNEVAIQAEWKVIPKVLAVAAEKATYDEWNMVIKYIKREEVYGYTDGYGTGTTLLHLAAKNRLGGADIVKFLVEEKKLDIHAKDKNGFAPFAYSLGKAIDYFVSKGIDVDCKNGNGDTNLIWCCSRTDIKVTDEIKTLLRLGADPDFISPSSGLTPLCTAAKHGGQDEAIPAILNALKGHLVTLPDGSEHYYTDWLNLPMLGKRFYGYTPLLFALEENKLTTIKALIACGADVNCDLTAFLHGYPSPIFDVRSKEAMKLMLDSGACMWSPDMRNYALHRFAGTSFDDSAIVEYLLQRGADPRALNHGGQTAYQLALSNRACSNTMAVLRKYNADVLPRK